MLANDVETVESESEDELSTENLEEDDESEIDFGESASEDELITDCDIDDSDADPDFKISMSDVDSDDDTGFTGNRPNEDMVSTSERGNNDRAIDPQLCTDNLVTVQSSVKNAKGNLNNKRHACLYCRKLMPNIARHLTNKHSNEHEVAIILMLPLRSKERKSAWQELVNKGDFSHNYQVIDKGHGTLIPKYRSRTNVDDIRSLLPCHSCRGFYKKTDLWKHQKICCVQKPTFLNSKHVRAGKLLMPHKQASKELFENVIVDMNDDEVKRTVESDDFILHHGNILYEEKGHEGYISSKLRELGRLLLSAKNMDADIKSILDLMKASKWDLLIAAIKNVAEYDEESCQFGIPSLVRNLGLSLKRCAEIEYSDATKNRNFKKRNLIETFLETYELKWKKCIGSTANPALEEKKCNKPQLVQLVEDVIKLNKHLEENVKRLCIQVEKNPMEYYADFVKICFAQVILFNRKRSEAAERITVKDILAVKSGGLVDDTIKKSLTLFEQKLSKSHSRVEIKGEKGARMPILLTAKMAFCLNKLLKYRDAAGVDDKTFLFARPGSAEQPYRGCDVLREFASDCNLKHPECITSTKARKQLATLTQILNLGENYQDVLESFKEHDIIVHGQFIQSPGSTLHVAKTFNLLNCLNSGTINKYKGCDFDDLDVDLQEILEEDDDERDIESDKSESEDELTTGNIDSFAD
ncbi:uncharacterized protein LOC128553984 [Mercenaria mercenaria]|uniref:uncharacterized protein LOC128553984 n=1 Tax=Mercenaria mercenaria TaxID=6596 RepID=UPI00234E74E8|nr:uncharacterized protein LOC128553984 [Mercenaria mercenaria]